MKSFTVLYTRFRVQESIRFLFPFSCKHKAAFTKANPCLLLVVIYANDMQSNESANSLMKHVTHLRARCSEFNVLVNISTLTNDVYWPFTQFSVYLANMRRIGSH